MTARPKLGPFSTAGNVGKPTTFGAFVALYDHVAAA